MVKRDDKSLAIQWNVLANVVTRNPTDPIEISYRGDERKENSWKVPSNLFLGWAERPHWYRQCSHNRLSKQSILHADLGHMGESRFHGHQRVYLLEEFSRIFITSVLRMLFTSTRWFSGGAFILSRLTLSGFWFRFHFVFVSIDLVST